MCLEDRDSGVGGGGLKICACARLIRIKTKIEFSVYIYACRYILNNLYIYESSFATDSSRCICTLYSSLDFWLTISVLLKTNDSHG